MSKIYISKDKVIINDEEYSIHYLKEIKLNSCRKIVILEEDIFIEKKTITKREEVYKYLEVGYNKDPDFLLDYFLLKNEMIIYAIKGGKNILQLCKGANKLFVKPIQIYVIDVLKKKLKVKEFTSIFKFRNSYYYIEFKNYYVTLAKPFKEIIDIENEIRVDKEALFIIDKNIKEIKGNNIIKYDYGEILNEKNIFKQKLFTY